MRAIFLLITFLAPTVLAVFNDAAVSDAQVR
jgi:hypothetical protein